MLLIRHDAHQTRGRQLADAAGEMFAIDTRLDLVLFEQIRDHVRLDAIGRIDSETGKWEPQVPDPEVYPTTDEPHARGAILVATLFPTPEGRDA